MSSLPVVIGVDVGTTSTDVVLICEIEGQVEIVSKVKEPYSSDVNTGVKKAILRALLQAKNEGHEVVPLRVNLSTIQFLNAFVEGKDLAKVTVIRLCGPVSQELPPFCEFPKGLSEKIKSQIHFAHGGVKFDGKEREPLDDKQIRNLVKEQKHQGIRNIVFTGIHSWLRPDQELRAREITAEEFPEASISLSHEFGHNGLLDRENTTILNECLKPLCKKTFDGLKSALAEIGLCCPISLTQNDGTITDEESVLQKPVLTFGSGLANTMKGASFLANLKQCIVVDIGASVTNVGVLKDDLPQVTTSKVTIGGVNVRLQLPNAITVAVGEGSYIKEKNELKDEKRQVAVGPLGAGRNIANEAFVFGDGKDLDARSLTALDVAVAAGLCSLGDAKQVKYMGEGLVKAALEEIHRVVEETVDEVKGFGEKQPVVLVGGANFLLDIKRPMNGATKVFVPEHADVAGAIGAAMSNISQCNVGKVNCAHGKAQAEWVPPNGTDIILHSESSPVDEQTSTGQRLDGDTDASQTPREPHIDATTGEWILSEWDIECIILGVGVYGCGGGGNIRPARIIALNCIRSGKRMRVVNPTRLFKSTDPKRDVVIITGNMGAPFVWMEEGDCVASIISAQNCLWDAFNIGRYQGGNLKCPEGTNVEMNKDKIRFVKDYQPKASCEKLRRNIIAAMALESAGENAISALLCGAELDIPIVDGDCESRAYPEISMAIPFANGVPPYPWAHCGPDGKRTLVLYSQGYKLLEDFLRKITQEHGNKAGFAFTMSQDEIQQTCPLHTISAAYRLGEAILRARLENSSTVEAIVEQENGKHIITGKVVEFHTETKNGFDSGHCIVKGTDQWAGQEILVEFRNENLIIYALTNGQRGDCLGTVPDMICVVDPRTGVAIQNDNMRAGMRAAVLLLPSHPLLRTPKALRVTGPRGFSFPESIQFQPFGQRKTTLPIPPQ